ncbi:hypothetical protein TNCV_5023371 [Trichonephila clavipes]|nr:hypothetical protein TNCV_5023371 [Trichonephila clavipes]
MVIWKGIGFTPLTPFVPVVAVPYFRGLRNVIYLQSNAKLLVAQCILICLDIEDVQLLLTISSPDISPTENIWPWVKTLDRRCSSSTTFVKCCTDLKHNEMARLYLSSKPHSFRLLTRLEPG